MTTVYYAADADLNLIRTRRIGIVGYGSQGHAHAQNLRESGCDVRVGAREDGTGWKRAAADGFRVQSIGGVSAWADVISLLLPDQYHGVVFNEAIRPQLSDGK